MAVLTKEYLDAIDVVCGECFGTEETCKTCPVRICCDVKSAEDNVTEADHALQYNMSVQKIARVRIEKNSFGTNVVYVEKKVDYGEWQLVAADTECSNTNHPFNPEDVDNTYYLARIIKEIMKLIDKGYKFI